MNGSKTAPTEPDAMCPGRRGASAHDLPAEEEKDDHGLFTSTELEAAAHYGPRGGFDDE